MYGGNHETSGSDTVREFRFSSKIPRKLITVLAVILLFSLFRFFVSFKLDWTWFSVLGYGPVFWKSFFAKVLVRGGIFTAALALNFLNLYLVFKVAKKPPKLLIILPLAVFLAFIVMGNSGDLWLAILKFLNAEPFGLTDPQFRLDIGFYVFKLPVLWLVYRVVNVWLLVNLVAALTLYLVLFPRRSEVSFQNITRRIFSDEEKKGLNHIGILLGLLMAWQAVQYKLSTYELLYSQAGSVIGAGAADIGARLPAYYLMMIFSVVIGLLIALTFSKRMFLAVTAIPVFFLVTFLAAGVFPGLYQKFIVAPDELGREKPYLERNIMYTRLAYGLDKLTEVEYPVGELTARDLEENRKTIDNIRLLDHRATKSTYGQQQEIRSYYDFVDVDVDRYLMNGKLTQVFLAGRELNQQALPEQARTFNNLMFKYTHGFGLAMSPANMITEAGLPQYFIKDIPPQSSLFPIMEPRIYFGEATKNNVIVNTGLKEFDYPVGDDNQEYLYQGKKGIPMSFLNKLLLTIRDMEFKYLLSGYITPESQYLETRHIKERVQRIAPFLLYDQDPYLVLGKDGKLYYFMDAYTVTDKFPYSQAVDGKNGFNYFRNSVKIILDAYSGEVNYYLLDQGDPIVRVYAKIYPGLFKPWEAFPQDLKEHIRYPEDLFNIQSLILRDYHMSNPTVFYNREDRWELAQELYWGKGQVQEPYYSIIKLPGEKVEEFVLMRSFTPTGKQNMVAWLAGRSDGANYGKLLLYKFPKGVQVPGTMQVESVIDQDPYISGQLTLWGQGGSRVLRGNLLVYPIGGSLLYVEPLYIEAEQNKFPQLKKVLVFYQDKIVMEDTLEKALNALFGTTTPAPAPADPGGIPLPPAETEVGELIKRLITLHKESKEKLKAGDWAEYGQLQNEIDRIIRSLEEKS